MSNKPKFDHKALKKPHYYGVMDAIHIFHGSHDDHKKHVGKHLENPSEDDLKAAIKEAKDKGLHHLYIHGSPPHSLRSQIHPELGPHVAGSLNKIEVVESWGEDEEEEEEEVIDDGLAKSKAIKNRKIFNPNDHHGKKVKVHWNLNRDCWTVKDHESGKLLGHSEKIALDNPSYEVSEAGRQAVLKQKKKGVHAHVVGTIDANHSNFDDEENSKTRTAVTYNPFKYDSFVQRHDPSQQVHQSEHVAMTGVAGGINRHGKPCNIPKVYAKGPSDVMTESVKIAKEKYAKKIAKEKYAKKIAQPTQEEEPMAKSDTNIHPRLKALHDAVREDAKRSGITLADHHFRVKPKKKDKSSPAPQAEESFTKPVKKSELKERAKLALKKIESEIVTISTRQLTKGLSYPESRCDACGCKVEGCLCFEGFSEPEFEFDGKNLKILFKSDWDDESKESYIDDFKRRAGRLLKK